MNFPRRILTEAVGGALLITGGVAGTVAQVPEVVACEDAAGNDMTETTRTEVATLVHCDSQYMDATGNTVHDWAKGAAIVFFISGFAIVCAAEQRAVAQR